MSTTAIDDPIDREFEEIAAFEKMAQQAHDEKERIANGTFQWLTVGEVALWAGLDRTVVWRAIERGTLIGRKLGTQWVVRRPEAEAYARGPRPIRKGRAGGRK